MKYLVFGIFKSMKMEDLNKTQIVLLTLLVSFMTSIATGIVTVSLMEQAPQSLPQTVNRVIERTVERVTPAVTGKPTVVTKETTVVVKEEDLITKSIETASKSILGVYSRRINTEGLIEDSFIGWGSVVNGSGTVITDSEIISSEGTYAIGVSGEIIFPAKVVKQNDKIGVAVLEAVIDKSNKAQESYVWKPITVSKTSSVKLGQTAIVAGGKTKLSVAIGSVTDINEVKSSSLSTSSPSVSKVDSIVTSVGAPQGVRGSLLLNSFGEVVGIYLGGGVEKTTIFSPVESIISTLF